MPKEYRIMSAKHLTTRDGSVNTGVISDIRASEEKGQTVIVQDKRGERMRHTTGKEVLKQYDNSTFEEVYDWPLGGFWD